MYVCLFTFLNIIIFIYYLSIIMIITNNFIFHSVWSTPPVLFRYFWFWFLSFCLCNVVFSCCSGLNHHQHKEIFQVKPFWCHECAKTFSSQSKLKQHMLIHSEEKPYMCDICERAFNVVSNLRRHLRTVHKETLAPSLELSAPRIRVWILSMSPFSDS